MIVLTGFPGFLASALLPRLLDRESGEEVVCVFERRFEEIARRRAADLSPRVRVLAGNITQPDLGFGGSRAALLSSTRELYHLAAVYDLAVERDLAERVNVDGTRHVLDFAAECAALERLHYVSTCYVSGRYAGTFTEADLDKGQDFNNAYEETKFLAEQLVRDRMAKGLRATIYRPAIVVGDSRSGATQKYDGPYCTIRWLLRQPRFAVVPLPFGAGTTELNVVPSDFVLDAIAWLSSREDTAGRTYQLADPEPLAIAEMLHVLARAADRRVVMLPVPFTLADTALRIPVVAARAPMPRVMLPYTAHRARYDTTAARAALTGSNIRCPPFGDYAGRLVAFVREHPQLETSRLAGTA